MLVVAAGADLDAAGLRTLGAIARRSVCSRRLLRGQDAARNRRARCPLCWLKTGDASAVHTQRQVAGVDVGELLRWPGVPPMFAVHDQDGNGLEIVEAA